MQSIDYSKKGTVFDIQRFSINDGPGIRTIVFLKGCPLRCLWCSNPESQNPKPELMYRSIFCIHCGKCTEVCKHGAIGPMHEKFVDRSKCVACGDCVLACSTSALIMKGKRMTVEEVINEVKKDETYYWNSGGGITVSGGEALTQPKFVKELFKAARAQGWHTAIETEGYVSLEVIEDVVPFIDLVLLDIKHTNPEKHKKFTAVKNELILSNAKRIQEISETIVRVPVVKGFNDTVEEFTDIVNFVDNNMPNVKEIHVLPYHNYGESKYEMVGKVYELKGLETPPCELIDKFREIVEETGRSCHVGG